STWRVPPQVVPPRAAPESGDAPTLTAARRPGARSASVEAAARAPPWPGRTVRKGRSMRKRVTLIVLGALAVVAAGCGSDGGETATTDDATGTSVGEATTTDSRG